MGFTLDFYEFNLGHYIVARAEEAERFKREKEDALRQLELARARGGKGGSRVTHMTVDPCSSKGEWFQRIKKMNTEVGFKHDDFYKFTRVSLVYSAARLKRGYGLRCGFTAVYTRFLLVRSVVGGDW